MKPEMRRRLTLLRALVTGQPQALAAWLEGFILAEEDIRWLHRQGLAVFGYHQMQQAGLLPRLDQEVRAAWQALYRKDVLRAATIDWEINHILDALSATGVSFV